MQPFANLQKRVVGNKLKDYWETREHKSKTDKLAKEQAKMDEEETESRIEGTD